MNHTIKALVEAQVQEQIRCRARMCKIYAGYPYETNQGGFLVLVIDPSGILADPPRTVQYTLDPAPSQALVNHSPDGFAWGYGGSGPAQLALALLLDATGNPDLALDFYQKFKGEVVAGWPMDYPWTYDQDQVLAWVGLRGREAAHGPDSEKAWPWKAPDPLPGGGPDG